MRMNSKKSCLSARSILYLQVDPDPNNSDPPDKIDGFESLVLIYFISAMFLVNVIIVNQPGMDQGSIHPYTITRTKTSIRYAKENDREKRERER